MKAPRPLVGALGGVVGVLAAGTGAVVVADRRVTEQRRIAHLGLGRYALEPAARTAMVRTPDGAGLYAEVRGPDHAAVTVVFVHGFCLTHDSFVLQQRALTRDFGESVRTVMYDQRRHGRSDPGGPRPPGRRDRPTIDQLGDDLATVIGELAPTGPLVLVGHSMGGMTIMALADAHPELFTGPRRRVGGVLLADTSAGRLADVALGLPAVLTRVRGAVVPLLLRSARHTAQLVDRGRAGLSDVAWVFVRRLSFGPTVDPALVEFVAGMIDATPVDVIADFYPAVMAHDKLHALRRLTGLPVVIVCGEDDVVTPPEHSRAIAAELPHAELVLVPGTGHMALLERPEAVDAPLARLIGDAVHDRSRTA